tara:strand:+ start:1541 stop:1762 length:222 start_codon:yes stop_codon:yes gene_type:complete
MSKTESRRQKRLTNKLLQIHKYIGNNNKIVGTEKITSGMIAEAIKATNGKKKPMPEGFLLNEYLKHIGLQPLW